MSAAEMTEPQRISFTLDPGLVLERLILKRLSGFKRKRGHDWLRSLVVQGFLAEGQWIRTESKGSGEGPAPQAPRVPITAFGGWLGSSERPVGQKPVKTAASQQERTGNAVTSGEKPFAHLRKVIG
jgi:hypothetical protein